LNELRSDNKYEQQHKTKITIFVPTRRTIKLISISIVIVFFIVVLSLSIPLVDATRKVKTVTVKQSSESCHPHLANE